MHHEYPLMISLAILLCCLASCVQDDDDPAFSAEDEYIVTYSVDAIAGGNAQADTLDWCGRLEYDQAVIGTQGGGSRNYSSSFGVRVDNPASTIATIASIIIGTDEPRDTLLGATTSPYENVKRFRDGANNSQAFMDLELNLYGNLYRTAIFNMLRHQIDKYDTQAVSNVTYSFITTGSCRGGDALIIQSDLFYDGFAYNVSNHNDSIYIKNFSAVIYNYSY